MVAITEGGMLSNIFCDNGKFFTGQKEEERTFRADGKSVTSANFTSFFTVNREFVLTNFLSLQILQILLLIMQHSVLQVIIGILC
jgi:hypothetical protein